MPQLAWLKQSDKPAAPEEAAAPATEEQTQADQPETPPEVQDSADKVKPGGSDDDANKAVSSPTQNAQLAAKPAEVAPATAATKKQAVSTAVASTESATSSATSSAASSERDSAGKSAAKSAVKSADDAESSAKPVQAVSAQAAASLNVSNSKDLLRLNFHEDSWVEIRRADKSVVISRLLKAGTSEAFDITEPVTVVIGNVAGVDASLRGSKLDIESGSNNNVARLSLK